MMSLVMNNFVLFLSHGVLNWTWEQIVSVPEISLLFFKKPIYRSEIEFWKFF